MGNDFSIAMGSDAFQENPKKAAPEKMYKYRFGKVLHPSHGNERRIAVNNATGKAYCMHRVCKVDESNVKAFHKEVEIMRLFLGHPNMVQLVEVYEDDENHIHLMTELCDGNLIDRFLEFGRYSEGQAAEAAHSLLETVAYCHSIGILIRDIKPENLLLSKSSNSRIARIKIGNLSHACVLPAPPGAEASLPKRRAQLCLNHEPDEYISSFYPAPEVLAHGPCSEASDVWSLGMVLYMALCGRPPFHGTPADELEDAIRSKELDFSCPVWATISRDAIDFICRMSRKDPLERATISELLAHPWLRSGLLQRYSAEPVYMTSPASEPVLSVPDHVSKWRDADCVWAQSEPIGVDSPSPTGFFGPSKSAS